MPVTPVKLVPGQPVETREAALLVAGIRVPGRYKFQLVVIDDLGRESAPNTCAVVVRPG